MTEHDQNEESPETLVPGPETIEAMREAREGNLASFATVENLMIDLNSGE